MLPLRQLLQHEFVVTAKVAEALYGEATPAAKVRLRDRATGQLRFTQEEYKRLVRIFRDMMVRLRTKADRFEAAALPSSSVDLRKVLDHPTLNVKQIVLAALPGQNYQHVYDRLRERGILREHDAQAIAATLRAFAEQIETALSQAKAEAKGYTFGLERVAQKDV